MSDWKSLAGWCVRSAFAAGVLWAFLNGTSTVNGVGTLERQGWPFRDPISMIGVGLVVGLIVRWRRAAADRARGREVAELCARSGFDFADEVSRDDAPSLPPFKSWASGRYLMSGERGGVRFRMLDVSSVEDRAITVSTDDGSSLGGGAKERYRTVALLPIEGVPAFDIRPRTRTMRLRGMIGFRGITFDPSSASDPAEVRRFGALFEVRPIDAAEDSERAFRRFFGPRVMRALNRHPGYSAQVEGGMLAVWRGDSFLPAPERTGLLDTAVALRAALTDPADAPKAGEAEVVLPALPGTDARSQTIRARNAVIGAIAGTFLGFFGNAILQHSTIHLRHHGSSVFSGAFLFFGGFFGSLAIGAALGAFLGSRVPVKPATGRRRDRKPDALPLPTRRGNRLSINPPQVLVLLPLLFCILCTAVGCVSIYMGVAGMIGWMNMEGEPVAGVIVGAIFALIGSCIVFIIHRVEFDLAARTWRSARGIWPIRIVKRGALDEASRVTVVKETRDGGESSVEVVVARLEWRDAKRKPLVLIERPIDPNPLASMMTGFKRDSRPAVRSWAREVAEILGLPLVDESESLSQKAS